MNGGRATSATNAAAAATATSTSTTHTNGNVSSNNSNNGYFIASFSPVKDVYKISSGNHSAYSSSSSLVSTGSRQQSSQHSTVTMIGSRAAAASPVVASQPNGTTDPAVPVQRSASFNSSCTVPLSISKATQVKNSASFSNCSILSKVAKKGSGLTASLTAHPLLRLSSSSATNLLKQQTTNGNSSSASSITNTSYSSNITEALANAGSNTRIPAAAPPVTKVVSMGTHSSSTGQLPSPSTASVSSTTSTVTSGGATAAGASLNQSTSTTALSLAQTSKNSIVDYYV
ncbi:putative GPI-anchored protein pfl2 [Anopheles albimanus]|uniref:Uncharacterized protein n=1 Tax=Anopheles albimanus TaxID=7167 RepID=A0A182FKF7_ANOAL|nr:putative GPI-anchored protein pfl2 [Anopheles albimanus]